MEHNTKNPVNTLRNGLTIEQVEKARELLKRVNVSAICRRKKIPRSIIENVLRDESPRVNDLKIVLVEANREIKRKEQIINSLPV